MAPSPARKAAFRNLFRIVREGAFSSEVLARDEGLVDARDLGLSKMITLGTLRNQRLLDGLIDRYSKRPLEKLDPEIQIILRMSAFQLVFLEKTPDYSVINDAVDLAKAAKKRSAAGLVNAVLRKISANDQGAWIVKQEPSRAFSLPRWIFRRWVNQYGEPRALEIAELNNIEPPVCFRFTSKFDHLPEDERSVLKKKLRPIPIEKSERVGSALIAGRSHELLRELREEGLIYFQSEASQLVAALVGETNANRILDVCAAPGSKATELARQSPDSDIFCLDLHVKRARTLRRLATNQEAELHVACADAETTLPVDDSSFDTVLVDAPCSGTGTFRRNPEIRYRLTEEDLSRLQLKQLNILRNASKAVRLGGHLIYSTCSLEREENEDVLSLFLQEENGFSVVPLSDVRELENNSSFLRLFPDESNADGFFAAKLIRGS